MPDRQLKKTLALVQRITDLVATIAAWEIAYFIRFFAMDTTRFELFENFLYYSFILAAFVVIFSTRNRLYESNRYFPWYRELLLVMKSQLQAVAFFVITLYFAAPNRLSRITIGLYAGIGLTFAVAARSILHVLLKRARSSGHNLRHVVVVGSGAALTECVSILAEDAENGVRFIGWVGSNGQSNSLGIPVLEMDDIVLEGSGAPDAVIIGYSTANHLAFEEALGTFNKSFAQILIIPEMENAFIGYTIGDFHGLPMITINGSRVSTFHAFFKRVIDLIGSLLGIILLSPLLLAIAIIIKSTSKGPVFYGQERMTQDGETFTMWKFRSMRIDAESGGAQWTGENDDRRTPIGTFLRRSSMDELPQLWNVLKGQMSLVGPRPERPVFIDKFKHEIPSYMLRHRMKSGMTGWAQVNGWRGDTSIDKRIEFDLYYIRNWSLMFDSKILILTLIKGIFHQNAY